MKPVKSLVFILLLMGISGSVMKEQPASESEDPIIKSLDFNNIILVERHAIKSTHVYTYHQEDNKPGGGLYILNLETKNLGKLVNSDNGLILDANLHYDGKTILFSWKKDMDGYFQLYTIDTEGKNLKQITDHPSNNFNACWLPNDEIAFLSDRKPAFAYCWSTTTPILYKCGRDGSRQSRLSANYLNDFTPSVMEDGRILYSRWEYVDRPAIPIQSLWSINPDGTKLAGVFGNRVLSPATFMDAREIPGSDGKILCVLTSHNRHCHGAIGIINPALGGNSQDAINNITPEIRVRPVDQGDGNDIQGPYVNPYPLDISSYLVSKDGSIELRTYNNSIVAGIIEGGGPDGLGYYSPQPVRIKNRERLVSSSLPPDKDISIEQEGEWAEIQMMDVYNGLPEEIERGSIKKLAIIQEMEKPLSISPNLRAFGFQFPVVSSAATYAPKKIWGFAKVEDDGSARFMVPARQPIYFLPIDEEGMTVQRMRTFTHLMPGEVQGCIGCHADRNYVISSRRMTPTAMNRPAEYPGEPVWGVKGFSYTELVQPVLDNHCIECHGRKDPAGGLELTGDKTDFFNMSYENLVRKGTPAEDFLIGGTSESFNYRYVKWIPTYNGQEANILDIEPGEWGSAASLLGKIIKQGHKDHEGVPRIMLDDEEKLKIYLWMDLNVPYYGGSSSNYQMNRGCRQQIPEGFNEAFADMASRRCISCHTQKDSLNVFSYPKQFALRIDNPELNPILMAPLEKKYGGSGKCGKPVFENTLDQDYTRILQTFYELQDDLEKRPRMDMKDSYLSPTHICVSKEKGEAYISLSTSFRIAVVDINKNKFKNYIDLTFNPGGLVLSEDSKTLIVADREPEGRVHFISTGDGKITKSLGVGHTPDALELTSDGSMLIVANRFSNSISVIDLKSHKLIKTIAVDREPVKVVISPDDQTIAVANLIPNSAADDPYVSATISLIDKNSLEVTQNIKLANGSQSIKGLAFSENGKYLYVSHILSRNNLPTSQIQHGWINSNAISVIDTDRKAYVTSFLLDNYNKGAANPSDIILSEDGKQLFIALSGVHELCIIDLPQLHALMDTSGESKLKNFPNDLMALYGLKDRIPVNGKSPRFLASYKGNILVSSYFSTFLEMFDVKTPEDVKAISLGTEPEMDNERRGELYFHDADLCFQKWQSCSSCHPDARADGLNWDLMNDGAGNSKNGKSLLYSHQTPPVMITGIRDKAETAVRAGIKYILFSSPEEHVADAIDSYLSSLQAVPSPFLSKGSLSIKAEKGQQLFITAGCMKCHSGKYHTDMQKYDVGTALGIDENGIFDVPTLSEVWRTAPYLYDGRAKTMMEVFTNFNPDDAHGLTGNLSEEDLECLVEYVLSL